MVTRPWVPQRIPGDWSQLPPPGFPFSGTVGGHLAEAVVAKWPTRRAGGARVARGGRGQLAMGAAANWPAI